MRALDQRLLNAHGRCGWQKGFCSSWYTMDLQLLTKLPYQKFKTIIRSVNFVKDWPRPRAVLEYLQSLELPASQLTR